MTAAKIIDALILAATAFLVVGVWFWPGALAVWFAALIILGSARALTEDME